MLYVAAPLLYSFLRCGEFLAPSGDKYVLTFTGDDTTPVSEVQTVFKLWLEANHKFDDKSGEENRIPKTLERIDALSMPASGKIYKCHECKAVVADNGEDSSCDPSCITQCPGGAWLAAHADFSVGKERGRHKMFGTSWYFGKTDGAPPLHIKGLRIDLNPDAGGMVAPEQEDE